MVNVAKYMPELVDHVLVRTPEGDERVVTVEYHREDRGQTRWLMKYGPEKLGGIVRTESDVGHLVAFRFGAPGELHERSNPFLTGVPQPRSEYDKQQFLDYYMRSDREGSNFYNNSFVYQKGGGQLVLGNPVSPGDGDPNGMKVYRLSGFDEGDHGFQRMRNAALRAVRHTFEGSGYEVIGFTEYSPSGPFSRKSVFDTTSRPVVLSKES